ncbi:class I SAM-dependent methyltransferase [Undibacterium flavidum]|uniref:Methyltransferase domain-containing protein n=1 Tax=Undibacterium flavidum TaxID=2762297 RepID=A0ABR6Y9W3_9BURK|nr:methyltransferase domain-containing protein [Undibacterium flavidum]MBC3873368.1 methyltransferase domain-containing protein [Undibacterium flavidum]
MPVSEVDTLFTGSIPQLYEEYMVPLIFEPYALDLAARVVALRPSSVLEIAAGTGVVTRQLANGLAPEVRILATDLNQAMLDRAIAIGTARPVEWQQADAMQLPFSDESFDLLVCQFGAMFFPDKPKAFAEARRVLRPGGRFIFNVWDAIEQNEFAEAVTFALQQMFPDDPPRFMARTPHGYADTAIIAQHLSEGGFASAPVITTVASNSRADSPRIPAIAYCQGTLLRSEIEARNSSGLANATTAAEMEIAKRFGYGVVEAKIQAHVIVIER